MRALEPTASGYVANPQDGVRIFYEIFGPEDAARTIVFSPAGLYAHSRVWKMQVPYFTRQGFRVVTYDCRGSGKSDRPDSGYSPALFAGDLLAVMDDLGIDQAALVGITWSIRWMGHIAAHFPERVTHLVSVSSFPSLHETEPLGEPEGIRARLEPFFVEPDPEAPVDWCAAHMRNRYPELTEAIAVADFPEPHSTKAIEDLTAWSREIEPEHLITSLTELTVYDPNDYFAEIRCPTLVIHGELDPSVPIESGFKTHQAIPGSEMVVFEGSGHVPVARDPVKVNLLIHEFLQRWHTHMPGKELAHARS